MNIYKNFFIFYKIKGIYYLASSISCRNNQKETAAPVGAAVSVYGAPGMGNDLAVEVRYRLGSRNC